MSVPVTRTLDAVLAEALSGPAGLRLIVGVMAAPPADTKYANVVFGATTIKVPRIAGAPMPAVGKPAYVLADETRMLLLGTV